jgi:hypothetical protein
MDQLTGQKLFMVMPSGVFFSQIKSCPKRQTRKLQSLWPQRNDCCKIFILVFFSICHLSTAAAIVPTINQSLSHHKIMSNQTKVALKNIRKYT